MKTHKPSRARACSAAPRRSTAAGRRSASPSAARASPQPQGRRPSSDEAAPSQRAPRGAGDHPHPPQPATASMRDASPGMRHGDGRPRGAPRDRHHRATAMATMPTAMPIIAGMRDACTIGDGDHMAAARLRRRRAQRGQRGRRQRAHPRHPLQPRRRAPRPSAPSGCSASATGSPTTTSSAPSSRQRVIAAIDREIAPACAAASRRHRPFTSIPGDATCRGWRIGPPARSSRSRPLVRRLLAPNPSPFTYTGTQTYIVGARRGRGDRSRARTCPTMSTRSSPPPRASGSRRSCAPTPIATTARPAGRSPRRPARRSSAARRSRSRMTARAPTPPSISTIAPDRVLADGEALAGDGWALARGGDAGPHLQPSLLRARRDGRPVHRRSCHGLVDHRGLAARRRHDRLYGEPRSAARPRRRGLSSRPRPGGRQAAPPRPRADRPPPDAREADPDAARRRGRGGSRRWSRPCIATSTRGCIPRPAARCSPISVDLEARGLVRSEGETWTLAA